MLITNEELIGEIQKFWSSFTTDSMHQFFISGFFYSLLFNNPFLRLRDIDIFVLSYKATVTMSSLSRLLLDEVVLEQMHLLEEFDSEGEMKF